MKITCNNKKINQQTPRPMSHMLNMLELYGIIMELYTLYKDFKAFKIKMLQRAVLNRYFFFLPLFLDESG